jgi:putative two-component system response regulator
MPDNPQRGVFSYFDGSTPGADAEPARVLVVDDDDMQRRLLITILEQQGYEVDQAMDGATARTRVAEKQPDIILLDVMLPDTDGFALTRALKARVDTAGIPVIIITARAERDARIQGLEAGAEDFLTKPVDHVELAVRVRNLLNLKLFHDLLRHNNRILERQVDEKTEQVRQQCIETVLTLMRAAEYRDETTGRHVNRISHYTVTLAERVGMNREFREQIFYASPMHDIGKLGIPDHILLKPAPLTENEWQIMKTHTTLGREILGGSNSPILAMGSQIAMSHHEYFDGSGYPQGLRGEEIPLAARIMTLCDVYDALRSKRPYKTPHSHTEAVETITRGDQRIRPDQFDPQLLDAFLASEHHFAQVYGEIGQRSAGH